ncbi:ninja-family protein Os05g0558800 isoform X2 [Phalaenopsis equestris]|uniref:ninja-family protein Os05g0558800 isoform X2 n=1 Tax=Phalaenopsis equestris TaxID=78828 RepID=UPI0009E47BFE|nr:ninja-family protein Os05g0558800 isoform X2 [Phalaenopsis equestris]
MEADGGRFSEEMDDENGLELSLGLSFGGSSSKSSKFKVKDLPSECKGDEGSSSRLMGGNVSISDESFKNFFKCCSENVESKGKQKSDLVTQPPENFFTDLAKCPTSMSDYSNDARNNLVQFTRYQEQLSSSNRTIETEDEKSGPAKRKLPFEEINFPSKHEKKSTGALIRNSHVSNTTEDGSTGENEDVAESEAEDPQSRLVSRREESMKCSDTLVLSGKNVPSESREPNLSGKESNPEYGKPTFGIPLSLQPLKVMNIPYPVMASAANTNSMQLAFGYPPAQLPTLETGSSWAFNSQPLNASSVTRREQSTGVPVQEHFEDGAKTSQGAAPHNTTAAFSYDGKAPDLMIGSSRYVGEAVSSARPDEQGKLRSNSTQANEATNKPATEALLREAPFIRPGIAPNLRFGGSGSYPDLPWVTTTGPGPNGKTVSGVTYKYNQNQIKIVCACHGTHMSPEEFVQHASSEGPNSENNPNLASFNTANTPNPAQS